MRPHCHDGSSHPQQSPSIETHATAPHTRCIGTSDSTSHTTNTRVVICQATQTTTLNIVANFLNTQFSQFNVYYIASLVGRGHKSRDCSSPKNICVSYGGYCRVTVDCPNCHAWSRKQRHRWSGTCARNGGGNHSRERRALLVAEAAAMYCMVVPTIVNRHIGTDLLGVNQKHASAVSTTLPWQLYLRMIHNNTTDLQFGRRH